MTAGGRAFVSSVVGGWVGKFFTVAWSSPRERAARNCPVLCCSWSITQYISNLAHLRVVARRETFLCNTWAPEPPTVAHINESITHIPLLLRHTQRRQHSPHRTARERNGCASRQPDSEVHVRVSAFTLHTQQMLAHAVTARRTSEPGQCWNFSYIDPTSDVLSPAWRCRFRRGSTTTRRRRGSHRTGRRLRHRNSNAGRQRKTHIGTTVLAILMFPVP